MGRTPRFQFEWELWDDKRQQNLIPSGPVSRLMAFNFGPHVTWVGWTSDMVQNGDAELDWIGTNPSLTEVLATGVKKIILATHFFHIFEDVFSNTKVFNRVVIRIRYIGGRTLRLLLFNDIEVGEIVTTDFSKLPRDFTGYYQISYTSISIKVKNPKPDILIGLESGKVPH